MKTGSVRTALPRPIPSGRRRRSNFAWPEGRSVTSGRRWTLTKMDARLSTTPRPLRPAIPRTVWALGFVSLFMVMSSEMIHALLAAIPDDRLWARAYVLWALIEGIAEATASIVEDIFGLFLRPPGTAKTTHRDWLRGLARCTKPLFAMAGAPVVVFVARFADQIGKGLRGAPRDALVADVTPEAIRGRAYGAQQALDTAGAFIGPLVAIALMALFANDMRLVFWFAVVSGRACCSLGAGWR